LSDEAESDPTAAVSNMTAEQLQLQLRVRGHYKAMRTNQTVNFVDKMLNKYKFDPSAPRSVMTVRDAFKVLENYVDSSDPDITLPNLVHMLQTAEGIRREGLPDWFQLVGLLHDMGKLMFLWGTAEDGHVGTAEGPQWALGGDTWIVGCRLPDCCVLSEFNKLNPDMSNPLYNTDLGMYQANCGLDNVKFAYGHDEYLYRMLIANKTTIPPEGLAMIRYHSCYPWHTGGAYRQLMNDHDHEMLKWVLKFNKYDLYTKTDEGLGNTTPDELWPYYQSLIDKYLPTPNLMW